MNNLSSNEILKIPIFNKEGEVFKDIFGEITEENPIDPYSIGNSQSGFESQIILGGNKRGSVTNSVEWHVRTQKNAVESVDINYATGVFLDLWGMIVGIDRLVNMSDADYKKYIKTMLFKKSDSIVGLNDLKKKWGFSFSTYEKMGFALGISHLNEPIRLFTDVPVYAKKSSLLVDFSMNRSIILTDLEGSKLGNFDEELISDLLSNMAVGTEYYIGVIKKDSFQREIKYTIPERYYQDYNIQKLGNMPEYEWKTSMDSDFISNNNSVWEKEIKVFTSGSFSATLSENNRINYNAGQGDLILSQIIKFCKNEVTNGYFYITPISGIHFPNFNTVSGSQKDKNILYGLPSGDYSGEFGIGNIYLQRNRKEEFIKKYIYSDMSKSFEEVSPYYNNVPPEYFLDSFLIKEIKEIAFQKKLKSFSIVRSNLVFTCDIKIGNEKYIILAGNIVGTDYYQYTSFSYSGSQSPQKNFINHPEFNLDTVKIGEFKIWA